MLLRKKRPEWHPEWDDLARYNTERHRGLVHTPEWIARMERVQRDFNEAHRADIPPDLFPLDRRS